MDAKSSCTTLIHSPPRVGLKPIWYSSCVEKPKIPHSSALQAQRGSNIQLFFVAGLYNRHVHNNTACFADPVTWSQYAMMWECGGSGTIIITIKIKMGPSCTTHLGILLVPSSQPQVLSSALQPCFHPWCSGVTPLAQPSVAQPALLSLHQGNTYTNRDQASPVPIKGIHMLIESRSLSGYWDYHRTNHDSVGGQMGVVTKMNVAPFTYQIYSFLKAKKSLTNHYLSNTNLPSFLGNRFFLYSVSDCHATVLIKNPKKQM